MRLELLLDWHLCGHIASIHRLGLHRVARLHVSLLLLGVSPSRIEHRKRIGLTFFDLLVRVIDREVLVKDLLLSSVLRWMNWIH